MAEAKKETEPKKRGRPPGKAKRGRGRPKGATSDYTMTVKAMDSRGIKPLDGEAAEYNRRLIEHGLGCSAIALAHGGFSPKKPVEVYKECLREYFELCGKNGIRPGYIAACTAMGINYNTMNTWARTRTTEPELRQFALTVTETFSAMREGQIQEGKLHPLIGIFWQRNYDGLRNDTEQVQNAREMEDSEDQTETISEIKQRYGDLLKE